MDAMMMIPAQVNPKAALSGGGKGRVGGESQESFAEYIEKKLDEAGRKNDLLGVKEGKKSQSAHSEAAMAQEVQTSQEGGVEDAQNLAALLSQFLQELQDMSQDSEKAVGGWSFSLPDSHLLEQLAADAGMDANQLASLLTQFEEQNGAMDLQNFLAALTRHFENKQQGEAVTVPETDLPFLETLMSKLGVPVEQIVDVADQGVTGDGQFNLEAFLEAMQEVEGNGQPIILSDYESARLREIFSHAGVADELQRQLLPAQEDLKIPFSMARMREMLQQGINNVRDSRPQLDLTAFLNDLQQVFSEAQFNEKNVGWSPAVQEAVTATYQELLKSVDLSTVQVKTVQGPVKPAEVEVDDETIKELHGLGDNGESEEQIAAAADAEGSGDDGEMLGQKQYANFAENAPAPKSAEGHAAAAAAAGRHVGIDQQMAAEHGRAATPAPQMPPGLAQKTFQNISNGVLNGLKNNEHHLVLRLYPRELGEVKVEMMVKDNSVSLSFAMENSRVKETLESNMQQFQENLARQGFNLQGCEVSVGQQQEDPNAAWQFFEQARQQQGQMNKGRETLADLPTESMYIRPIPEAGREGGISLFI